MPGFFDPTDPTAGGLMGNAASPGMGFMGMFADPQTAGLLGMAGGLLQAAGPSRIPVTNGQALGGGLMGMQQGIGNAMQTRMQMAKFQSMMDPFGSGFGGAPAQGSTPQAGPAGAPVTGAANTGPMSGPSAGMGPYAGYGGAPDGSSGAGSAGANGSSSPTGPLIMGHTPQEWVTAGYRASALGNPAGAEMIKLGTSFLTPTDAMKLAGAAYGVGTPEYQTALQNQAANAGATSIRPGGGIARGNQISMIPQAVPGFVAVQDPNSPSGWKQVAVENGPDAIKSSAAASSIGKAYGNVVPGFNRDTGLPEYGNEGAIADQTAGNTPLFGGGNGRYPGGGTQPQGGMTTGGGSNIVPGLGPAESAAQTTMGEKSASQYASEQQAAGGYGTRMFNLQKALTGLQSADTGPGSDTVNTARSFLMAQGPQVLQSLGIVDPNKIQSYDEANKYLTQYAMNQAGALGEGTDAKLATTLSGNASTHISNLAAQDVVRANMALERMNQAAVNSFINTGLSPSKYSAWKAQFASKVDPRVFAWDTLDKSKQQAMYNGMNDAQRNQFRTQYNWATQNGFLGQ